MNIFSLGLGKKLASFSSSGLSWQVTKEKVTKGKMVL